MFDELDRGWRSHVLKEAEQAVGAIDEEPLVASSVEVFCPRSIATNEVDEYEPLQLLVSHQHAILLGV